MMRQAFRTYMASLHPRNIKKLKENGQSFWIFYWLFLYPLILDMNTPDYAQRRWFLYGKLIPLFIIAWSSISLKSVMPKAMFLAPMKERQRREYINAMLVWQIGFPTFIGIVNEVIWSVFHEFHPVQSIAIVFVHFSLAISNYIRYIRVGQHGKKKAWGVLNITQLLLCIFLIAGLEVTDMAEWKNDFATFAWMVIFTVILVLDIGIVRKNYTKKIEQDCDYELCFAVEGKVPTMDDVDFDLFAK